MQQNRDGLAPWMVLILPYLEESARHETFNFLASFNGLIPDNSATVSGNRGPQSVPNSKYQCPSDPNSKPDLPDNERRRLQLHFSKNMIDWCFTGLVAVGPSEHASRHSASMAIDGDDLVILSRSGDPRPSRRMTAI